MPNYTQVESVNETIQDFLNSICKIASPHSIYLLGSYADNTYIPSSDIDLCIITNTQNEKDLIKNYVKQKPYNTNYPLDLTIIDKSSFLDPRLHLVDNLLWRESVLNSILASKLIWGKDIKNKIKLPSNELYTKYTIPIPLEFIGRIRNQRASEIKYPLIYPNQGDYYYGYLDNCNNLKLIVSNVGWIATALIALKGNVMIGKKSSVVNQYELIVNNEWNGYIKDVFHLCRDELQYSIPQTIFNKARLKKLCSQLLSFENHYMKVYEKKVL